MSVSYSVILQDDFDWNYVGKNKNDMEDPKQKIYGNISWAAFWIGLGLAINGSVEIFDRLF